MSAVLRHGTRTGYNQHMAAGENPCPPCQEAAHEYEMRRKRDPRQVLKSRQRARAQTRAGTRLRRAHPDEYAVYYAAALVEVVSEDGTDYSEEVPS